MPKMDKTVLLKIEDMNEFLEIYRRIGYLRNKGVKMKEIADRIDMTPSVLSSLYTTVFPAYFEAVKKSSPDDALDYALSQVNNVSRKRLLANIGITRQLLAEFEPEECVERTGSPFVGMLGEEMLQSTHKAAPYCGQYMSYSLSSSADSLKIEPFLLAVADNGEYLKVGRISAYRSIQWGVGIVSDYRTLYLSFSETPAPQLALVTIYLQLPLHDRPDMLRGLYMTLDYNHNPIARRIVFVRCSEQTDLDSFLEWKGGIVEKGNLTDEQQVFYDYTCQAGDYIKMCSVPSPRLDCSDLTREKKMLEI